MNFLCPACRTPLPVAAPAVVACAQCGVEVDLTRVDTAPGQARLWPEVDLKGEQLSTYRLGERAGAGGMGTVYVAEGLLGPCAVKVLSAALAADPFLRERFRREAQALRQLQHPNVVRIIEEGQDRGFCWYAMEHVPGIDLRARLQQGPLSPPEVEKLARELLGALGAVHAAQLVHRDLKPANILLSPTGARLCDFGIARFDGATTLTETAALLGSLRYMAPEQRAGQTSPKSDLYSLGLVLHEALTGGLPGEKDLPRGQLTRLIEALLQAHPSRRPADAHAALKLLEPARRTGLYAGAGGAVIAAAAAVVWAAGAFETAPVARAPARAVAAPQSVDAGALELAEAPGADAGGVRAALVPGEPAPDAGVQLAATAIPDPTDAAPDAGVEPSAPGPGARGPARVVMRPATVEGGLGEDVVSLFLQKHRREIAGCYEKELDAAPELAGLLSVRFTVARLSRQGRAAGGVLRPLAQQVLAGGPKKPPAKGKVEPAEPVGVVIEASVAESTLRSAAVIACVLARVRSWKFPEPKGGPATVAVAWTFAPGPALGQSQPSKLVAQPVAEGQLPEATVKPAPSPPAPVSKPMRSKGKPLAKQPTAPAAEGP